MNRKELLEKYRSIVKEQNDYLDHIVAERRSANPAFDFKTDEAYVKREADIAHYQGLIAAQKENEERSAQFETEYRNHELRSRENRTSGDHQDEKNREVEAFATYIRTGNPTSLQYRSDLVTTGSTTGGYLVPTIVSAQVIQDIAPFESVRQAGAQVIAVQGNVNIPIAVDPTAHFISEDSSLTASDPTFNRVQITPNLLEANTKMTWQLINRSAADVVNEVTKSFVRAIAKLEASSFLTGGGSGAPQGLLPGGTQLTATASTSTFTTAELMTCFNSINPIYAMNGTWIMSPSAAQIARGLQTTNGPLVWYNNLVDGSAQLLGRPVIVDANMPAVGAAATPVVFSDVNSAYIIGEETQLRTLVDPYTAAGTGEVKIYIYKFVDGRVKKAAAAQVMVMAAS